MAFFSRFSTKNLCRTARAHIEFYRNWCARDWKVIDKYVKIKLQKERENLSKWSDDGIRRKDCPGRMQVPMLQPWIPALPWETQSQQYPTTVKTREHNQYCKYWNQDPTKKTYTTLNTTKKQIFVEIRNAGLLSKPQALDNNMSRKNKIKFCGFHCDWGYNTAECFELREHIEDLVRNSYLDRYVDTKKVAIRKDTKVP